MDFELWKSEEFKQLNNYIFIEVDIDVNNVLSSKFRVSSIPRVIIQVANTQNDIFVDKLGYSSKKEYLRELQYFNSFNYSELYENDDTFENNGNSYRNLFFNDISKKNTFLKLSSNYFRKALKANESKLNQLNLIYNQALIGQHKKAKKKLKAIEEALVEIAPFFNPFKKNSNISFSSYLFKKFTISKLISSCQNIRHCELENHKK